MIWAGSTMVAAAMKFTESDIWIGAFNFSDSNQHVSLQFDNPALPIDDGAFYAVADPTYTPVTGKQTFFTGRELRISRIHTTVTFTDRIKLLKIERIRDPDQHYRSFLRDSFFRLAQVSDGAHFPANFSFQEMAGRIRRYEKLRAYVRESLISAFGETERPFLELGIKRSFYHIYRNRIHSGEQLLEYIRRFSEDGEEEIQSIGRSLQEHNRTRPFVFVSAEADPFSKSGGLANVVYELPRELVALGETVYVITPYYRHGDPKAVAKMRNAAREYGARYSGVNVRFHIRDRQYEVGVHRATVEGVEFFLLDHHEFFDGLYWGYTAEEKLRRRAALARAGAEVITTFGLGPNFVLTNDAYSGLLSGVVRSDPGYAGHPELRHATFLHIIHNGGWQYFDSYYRYERGDDLFALLNLPAHRAGEFSDPTDPNKISCMAAGVRFADRVVTVSPSYAEQIQVACDGMESLLHDVLGINNALGKDFLARVASRFEESDFLDAWPDELKEAAGGDPELRDKLESRYPELLAGPQGIERMDDPIRRELLERMRNKLLLQKKRRLAVDPDMILFTMIHRIAEQKGFQLLLEASEGLFKSLGFQGILGGQTASGDRRGEEIAEGLKLLQVYYPDRVSVNIGFQDVSVPLLCSDVFLMPSMHEPGGISQLEALVCGSLVVARATGGLRDTVIPLRTQEHTVLGNGFLFSDFTPWSFYDAMKRCAQFFRSTDEMTIQEARMNARRSVHYWDTSARRYIEKLYDIKEIIRTV